MKATHTPGPWHIEFQAREPYERWTIAIERDDLRSVVARIGEAELCEEHGGTAGANARLIAAAPELLEALRDAEFLMRKLAINPREIGAMLDSLKRSADDARAAIAKAEGE